MKLLLKVFLILMATGVILYGGTFFLPARYEVTQTQLVDATPEQVFSYLNNPTQWPRWTVWSKEKDPTLILMYGGPLSGEGAQQSWSGDMLGESRIIFTQSIKPSTLTYEQTLSIDLKVWGSFTLEELNQGTRITWQQVTNVPDKPIAKLNAIWQKYKTEEELMESLKGLKELLDQESRRSAAR
ncbi:SRPBCC family protein [Pontibacter vulgaris]|uniref:SRPBCC family protein n=1 Tax=Pontibacter vulgaris TaxID=2905679 RepID=UPI001FA8184C|nr:SRPBCC family protein [Pontibacter vulgaris]